MYPRSWRILLLLLCTLGLIGCNLQIQGQITEEEIHLQYTLQTFTPTTSPTPPEIVTATPVETQTTSPTETETPTETATETETPTETATPTATETPTEAATEVPTPLNPVPPVPPNFAATALSPTEVVLTWTAVGNATAYRIEMGSDGSAWSFVVARGHPTSSHTISGLSPGTPYFFRVRSINNVVGHSEWSVTSLTTPKPNTQTPSPTPDASAYSIPYHWSVYAGDHVPPGSNVCIEVGPDGSRGRLTVVGLKGTAAQPIRLGNCGQVVLFRDPTGRAWQLFILQGNHHVHVSGDDLSEECGTLAGPDGMPIPYPTHLGPDRVPHQQCGIVVLGGANGLTANQGNSNLEVSHLWVRDSTPGATFAAGVNIANDTGGVFENLHIHHNYFLNTGNECIYVGRASHFGDSAMQNVLVEYNWGNNCGWNGINIKQSRQVLVHRNIIRTAGIENEISNGHGKGVGIVASDGVEVRENEIMDTAEECIKTLTMSDGYVILIENNLIGGCGSNRDHPAPRYHVLNNFSNVRMTVRNNSLLRPGSGINVRGSGVVEGNVWLN